MLSAKEQKLFDAIDPIAQEKGIEIVTIEIVGSRKAPTIRIYIDCEGGVGFDELSSAQAWINALMDEIDPFPGAYTLEISSPGIDRPLRTMEHFARFEGEKAQIILNSPLDGRTKWVGILKGTSDGAVLLEVDEKVVELAFSSIKKANIIATIDFNA